MSRLNGPSDECAFTFQFQLVLSARMLILHAACRDDRAKWIKVFETIIRMNKQAISTKDVNPLHFDFW